MEGIVLVSWVSVQLGLCHKDLTDDSGEKSQRGKDGDTRTYSTHTHGGPEWIGSIRENRLEYCVQDTRDKEHNSSDVVNYCHCCFLERCNDAHAQAGEHPKHKTNFIEPRVHHPCVDTQLLHILVPGIDGGSSCACRNECHQAKNAALWGVRTCVTYVWKDYVDITSEKRNKVGNNESAGGPDDQKHW